MRPQNGNRSSALHTRLRIPPPGSCCALHLTRGGHRVRAWLWAKVKLCLRRAQGDGKDYRGTEWGAGRRRQRAQSRARPSRCFPRSRAGQEAWRVVLDDADPRRPETRTRPPTGRRFRPRGRPAGLAECLFNCAVQKPGPPLPLLSFAQRHAPPRRGSPSARVLPPLHPEGGGGQHAAVGPCANGSASRERPRVAAHTPVLSRSWQGGPEPQASCTLRDKQRSQCPSTLRAGRASGDLFSAAVPHAQDPSIEKVGPSQTLCGPRSADTVPSVPRERGHGVPLIPLGQECGQGLPSSPGSADTVHAVFPSVIRGWRRKQTGTPNRPRFCREPPG